MLEEKGLTLVIEEDVKYFLIQHGYDVTFGTRHLKQTIQRFVINPLSAELLMNKYENGNKVVVRYPGAGKLIFENESC